LCKYRVDLEVTFGDTTRAVANMATTAQTRKSFGSIAIMALRVGIELVVWMIQMIIVEEGEVRRVFGDGMRMARTARKWA
jgi:hypothetical protein